MELALQGVLHIVAFEVMAPPVQGGLFPSLLGRIILWGHVASPLTCVHVQRSYSAEPDGRVVALRWLLKTILSCCPLYL